MKKIKNLKDLYKILIVYFISTIVSAFIEILTVKYDYIPNTNYRYCLIGFTLTFLVLIKLFRIKFKSILIFLGIIMFLLIFMILNLDYFSAMSYELVFPVMFIISLLLTLPFQHLFLTLEGYRIIETAYIVVPIYMIVFSFLCYIILKFNIMKKDN